MSDSARIRPPGWLKYVNKVMIGLQKLGMVEMSTEEARPVLRAFPVEVPSGVGFIKNVGLVTGPNPDQFEALAGRLAVFRLDPVNV